MLVPRQSRPDMPSTVGGRYAVLSRLGAGGMAVVYRAKDTRLLREVAIKVLRQSPDPASALMFNREARAAASLRHPSIVQVYDFSGIEEAPPYLVLELVDGVSLDTLLAEQHPLPDAVIVAITQALASALAHAHERGVVHRDVKPANVLVERSGRVCLSDFGIAKAYRDPTQLGATVNLAESRLVGTPAYMAPEQVLEQPAGPPADVFAMGSLIYALVTGRPPFGPTGNMVDTMRRIIDGEYPPIESVSPNCPHALREWVAACLARDPQARPPALDLARWSQAWLSEHGVANPALPIAGVMARISGPAEEWPAESGTFAPTTRIANPAPPVGATRILEPAAPADPAWQSGSRAPVAPKRRLPFVLASVAVVVATVSWVALSRVTDAERGATPRVVPMTGPIVGPMTGPLVEPVAELAAGGETTPQPSPPLPPVAGEATGYREPVERASPRVEASPRRQAGKRGATEPTVLEVSVRPWGKVEIDGQDHGNTPVFRSVSLAAGKHRVVVSHPSLGRVEQVLVLKGGQHRLLSVDLQNGKVEQR